MDKRVRTSISEFLAAETRRKIWAYLPTFGPARRNFFQIPWFGPTNKSGSIVFLKNMSYSTHYLGQDTKRFGMNYDYMYYPPYLSNCVENEILLVLFSNIICISYLNWPFIYQHFHVHEPYVAVDCSVKLESSQTKVLIDF